MLIRFRADYGMFAVPMMAAERVSYPVPPFSAVRGLAVAGFKLSAALPVGDVTVGPDACYVPCWLGGKKPYLSALSEPGLAERVKAQMFHDRALELARKAAQGQQEASQAHAQGGQRVPGDRHPVPEVGHGCDT